jgi:hypothetical protein
MKTTIDISDELLREAREVAKRDGISLQDLIEAGLREALGKRCGMRFRLRDGSFKRGKGLHPEVQRLDWDQIRELSYGDRGGTSFPSAPKPSPRKVRGR